jgi:hypothetical protein
VNTKFIHGFVTVFLLAGLALLWGCQPFSGLEESPEASGDEFEEFIFDTRDVAGFKDLVSGIKPATQKGTACSTCPQRPRLKNRFL